MPRRKPIKDEKETNVLTVSLNAVQTAGIYGIDPFASQRSVARCLNPRESRKQGSYIASIPGEGLQDGSLPDGAPRKEYK